MSETDERIEFRGHCRSMVYYLHKIRVLLLLLLLFHILVLGGVSWFVLWLYGIV